VEDTIGRSGQTSAQFLGAPDAMVLNVAIPAGQGAAAKALTEQVTPAELNVGLIYPPQSALLKTEMHIAKRIAEVIFARRLARVKEPHDLGAFIESHIYKPDYQSLV